MTSYDRRRINGPVSHPPIFEKSQDSTGLASRSKRPLNRPYDQVRPIFLQTNLVPSASGSSYIEIGNLKLACSVFGPRQVRGRQYAGKAELNVEVKFAPFSSKRRRKPGKNTESAYLSSLVHQALLPSLRLDLLPKASLDVHIMVLESDGLPESCVSASTIAASTALASAGIEMYGLVVGAVSLVPSNSASQKVATDSESVLLDPSLADLSLPGMKNATRILLCGMPALSSVTCLDISAGAVSQDNEDNSSSSSTSSIQAGIDPSLLERALENLNTCLNAIHAVVAKALTEDFQRRQAVLANPE